MSLRLCGALLAACGVLLSAGCGGSDSTPGAAIAGQSVSYQEISRAAATSADATSGRFAFGLEVTMPGADDSFAFSGEGAFDATAQRASFSVDMSSFASLLGGLFSGLGATGADAPDFDDPSAWKIEAIKDGDVAYVRFPAIDDQLPAGKSWVRAREGETARAAGFELKQFDQFTGADPRELLELLRGVSGQVETVGTEVLRGADTTHYRAILDAASIAKSVPESERKDATTLADQLVAQSGVAEVPLDIWIDANGIVRKFQLDVSAKQPGATEAARAAMTFELWDVGEAVGIDLPPASQVVDASAVR